MAKSRRNGFLQRRVKWPLEAAALHGCFLLLRLLPIDRASALGGFLGRTIGPRLPVNGRAVANLKLAFPGIAEAEIGRITRGMWDNLGRVLGEFPHLAKIVAPESGRLEMVGLENVLPIQEAGQGSLIVSGHIANWEVMNVLMARLFEGNALAVMREPNNPLVRSLLHRLRDVAGGRRTAKGPSGAKQIVAMLRSGGPVGMLCDQKLNNGIAAPFFGIQAMTAPTPAQLALRFSCPVVPTRLERLGGARFRLTCYPPLELPDSGDSEADILALTTRINGLLEDWIRERPQDWFWLHRRWPKATYAECGFAQTMGGSKR